MFNYVSKTSQSSSESLPLLLAMASNLKAANNLGTFLDTEKKLYIEETFSIYFQNTVMFYCSTGETSEMLLQIKIHFTIGCSITIKHNLPQIVSCL